MVNGECRIADAARKSPFAIQHSTFSLANASSADSRNCATGGRRRDRPAFAACRPRRRIAYCADFEVIRIF
jgi:hypothetical protein